MNLSDRTRRRDYRGCSYHYILELNLRETLLHAKENTAASTYEVLYLHLINGHEYNRHETAMKLHLQEGGKPLTTILLEWAKDPRILVSKGLLVLHIRNKYRPVVVFKDNRWFIDFDFLYFIGDNELRVVELLGAHINRHLIPYLREKGHHISITTGLSKGLRKQIALPKHRSIAEKRGFIDNVKQVIANG
jgi:hypothetical protein